MCPVVSRKFWSDNRVEKGFIAIISRARILLPKTILKGAFETPPGISISRGDKLDQLYMDYVDQLLAKGHKCSIATHHDKIQQEAKGLIFKYKSSKEIYDFESLYGIRNENLAMLKEEGFHTRVYFVYGKEWYLYLCNRIAEYPLNIFQALNDIVEVG